MDQRTGRPDGLRTRGKWRDHKTDKVRPAKPWDPVLVAGGGVPGGDDGVAQPQTDFIHNSTRPLNGKVQATGSTTATSPS